MLLKSDYNAGDCIFRSGIQVAIHSVIDNYERKECDVNVSLNSATIDAVRCIGQFTYIGTWEDSDVIDFIKTKMGIE